MKKEFRASLQFRIPFLLAALLVTIGGAICFAYGISLIVSPLGQSHRIYAVLLLLIGFTQFLSAWAIVVPFQTTRLVISPEKLEYHFAGLALTTTWHNVERIASIATLSKSVRYDSLVLHSAATQETTWWFKLLRKHPEKEIPLSLFAHWKESEIGQEIRKYAPHLFLDGGCGK